MYETTRGSLETYVLKRKETGQRNRERRFWSQIEYWVTSTWVVTLTLWLSVWKVKVQTRGLESWSGKAFSGNMRIWIFAMGEVQGRMMRRSLSYCLSYNQNNTSALPQWVPSWIPYAETTTSFWFSTTAWPNRKLVLMSTEFKLFVKGGSLASTQWVSCRQPEAWVRATTLDNMLFWKWGFLLQHLSLGTWCALYKAENK